MAHILVATAPRLDVGQLFPQKVLCLLWKPLHQSCPVDILPVYFIFFRFILLFMFMPVFFSLHTRQVKSFLSLLLREFTQPALLPSGHICLIFIHILRTLYLTIKLFRLCPIFSFVFSFVFEHLNRSKTRTHLSCWAITSKFGAQCTLADTQFNIGFKNLPKLTQFYSFFLIKV